MKLKKRGFTLMELLMVVLIIGILSAVAVPMYKKALEKSRVSDALSVMDSVAKSEHNWYLVKNNYTQDFADLDIDLTDKDGNKAEDDSFESQNYTFTLQDYSIKAVRKNGEYTLYKAFDNLGTIYCTPNEHYICQQYNWLDFADKCKNMGGAWAYSNATCYANEEERCKGLGNNWNGTFCGYTNEREKTLREGEECRTSGGAGYIPSAGGSTVRRDDANARENAKYMQCGGSIIKNGGICQGNGGGAGAYVSSCSGSIIEKGGICNGNNDGTCLFSEVSGVCNGNQWAACQYSTIKQGGVCNGNAQSGCTGSIIEKGGTCVGNIGGVSGNWVLGSCRGLTVQAGGKCIAKAMGTCAGTYEPADGDTPAGCCEDYGQGYCPASAPKC